MKIAAFVVLGFLAAHLWPSVWSLMLWAVIIVLSLVSELERRQRDDDEDGGA